MEDNYKEIELDDLWKLFKDQEGKADVFTKESEDEEDLKDDEDIQNFRVANAYIKKKGKTINFKIRNFFLDPNSSELNAFGHIGNFEFRLEGSLYITCEFDIELISDQHKISCRLTGDVERKEANDDFVFVYREDDMKFKIKLQLDPWKGNFTQDGKQKDARVSMDINGSDVVGLSKDEAGLAIWKGKQREDKLTLKKEYILSHDIKYAGTLSKDALPVFTGKWEINGVSDNFTLTKQERKPKVVKTPEKKKEKPKPKKDNKAKKEEKKKAGKKPTAGKLKAKLQEKKKQKKEGKGKPKKKDDDDDDKKGGKKGGKKKDDDSDDDKKGGKKGGKKPENQIQQQPVQQQPQTIQINVQQPQQQYNPGFQQQQYNPGPQQQVQHQVNPQPFPQQNDNQPQQRVVHVQASGCCNIF